MAAAFLTSVGGAANRPARAGRWKAPLARLLWAVGAERWWRAAFNARHPGAFRILSAHRALDERGPLTERDRADLARGCLTLAQFRERVAYLAAHYRLWRLGACVQRLRAGLPLPANTLALTFDDGCADVGRHVWPLLAERRLPFTVFLTTGRLGQPGMLTEAEVRELARAGAEAIEWGAHGVTHRPLTDLPPDEARRELAESRARVEELAGRPVELFSYPDGRFNAPLQRLAAACGYAAACATGRRVNSGRIDLYALWRIPCEAEPLARFAWRVAGRV